MKRWRNFSCDVRSSSKFRRNTNSVQGFICSSSFFRQISHNFLFDKFLTIFFLTFLCLYPGTQQKKVLPRSISITIKCYFPPPTTFLFSQFREGVQEGYVRKEGMVDAILYIIPGHPFSRTQRGWVTLGGIFSGLYFYKFNFKIIYWNFE